jgi:hypothetical protein
LSASCLDVSGHFTGGRGCSPPRQACGVQSARLDLGHTDRLGTRDH